MNKVGSQVWAFQFFSLACSTEDGSTETWVFGVVAILGNNAWKSIIIIIHYVYCVRYLIWRYYNTQSYTNSRGSPSKLCWQWFSTCGKNSLNLFCVVYLFCLLVFLCQRAFPLITNIIFNNIIAEIPSAQTTICGTWKSAGRFFVSVIKNHVHDPNLRKPGWGLPATDCSLTFSFDNGFLLYLGACPFLSISWEEKRRSCWSKECFGCLMTQKQWEKCKQSLDGFHDSSFLAWQQLLVWRDKH